MPNKRFQDILPLVERPSRYLGTETNRVIKDPAGVKLSFALAFPDLYEIGTSHFGMQILYDLLNRQEDIAAERVFAPAVDAEARLRKENIPMASLESRRSLGDFDIIGFSLLYELNYTNILTLLDLAGIPFYAKDRDPSHPMVIAGGPCTSNPEPVADFFDAVVVGDGEVVILELTRAWMAWKDGGGDREALLKEWAAIAGVYIPSFYTPDYDARGIQTLVPAHAAHGVVSRAVLGDLDGAPFPTRPVIPFGRPVHDRLRLEVARGCTRGCRFCQAGMIYRPVRERTPDTLMQLAQASLDATGYSDISLLSLSTGDYGCIVPLLERLMDRWGPEHIAVSLPSLRAGNLTPELIQQIRRVRKTGFTIAPEAGSQRMRDIINKNISEEEIVAAVRHSFELGWQVIKLYFMIGLPFETAPDVAAIVDLVQKLRPLGRKKGQRRSGGKINVSTATFIPKAHTPFQWAGQLGLEASQERLGGLREKLRLPGVQFKWQDPRVSYLEGLWARGDRRLAPLLVAAYRKGCRFDGWSEQFDFSLWQDAFEETGINPDDTIVRARALDEPLPWDHIDIGVDRAYLLREWERAAEGQPTGDCRQGECNACGVCDFDAIEPVVHTSCEKPSAAGVAALPSTGYSNHRLTYSKTGLARFFGHLEMVNLFTRAFKRSRIAVKYTEGFHPKPKIAFEDALPIGMESLQEYVFLPLAAGLDAQQAVTRLNQELPEGVRVAECRPVAGKGGRRPAAVAYRVALGEGVFDSALLDDFMRRPETTIFRKNKKGRAVPIDLKAVVMEIELLSPRSAEMLLRADTGKSLRPVDIMREVFQLKQESLQSARITKTRSVY